MPETEGEPTERIIPALPRRGRRRWHPLTQSWWEDVWASPMAPEFLRADLHGLYILADLIDQYWRKPAPKLAGEIRQQRTCFGLTPIDRRRLQWEVERGEEAEAKRQQRQSPKTSAPEEMESDPRKRLRMV